MLSDGGVVPGSLRNHLRSINNTFSSYFLQDVAGINNGTLQKQLNFITFLLSLDLHGDSDDNPGIFREHDIDFRRGLRYGVWKKHMRVLSPDIFL